MNETPDPSQNRDNKDTQPTRIIPERTGEPSVSQQDQAPPYFPGSPYPTPPPATAPFRPEVFPPTVVQSLPTNANERLIYVQPPKPPRMRGNRGFGLLITLIALLAFAIVYALIIALLGQVDRNFPSPRSFFDYLGSLAFWIPVGIFTLSMIFLILIVNRGRWWGFVLGGFFVGIFTYGGVVGGGFIGKVIQAGGFAHVTAPEGWAFVSPLWLSPLAILAGVAANLACVWFGAWIAWRGRKVTVANIERYALYDRELHNMGFTTPSQEI